MRRKVERRAMSTIAGAAKFYPKYFEDYDIEADMDMVDVSKRFDDYRDMGGFLDKISYFEVKSITRSRESRKSISRSMERGKRLPVKERPSTYEDFALTDVVRIPGTPFIAEKGDVIRVYKK